MTTAARIADIGHEIGVYPTPVAATARLMELTDPPIIEPIDANVYVGTDQGVVGPPSGSVVTRMAAMARIAGRWTFEDAGLYWQAIVGAVTPTGAGPYTRTYNVPRTNLPPLYPYTVVGGYAGNVYRLPGGLLTQLQMGGDWGGDGIWTHQVEFYGQKKDPVTSGNEVQTLTMTGSPTGGNLTLGFQGQVSNTIAYNATSAQVQTALDALATIGAGNSLVAGGPWPGTPITVTFQGTLAGQDLDLLTLVTNALTPSGSVTIAETTKGGGLPTVPERTVEKISMANTNLWLDPKGAVPGTTALPAGSMVSFGLTLNTGRRPLGGAGSAFATRATSGRYTGELRLRLMQAAAVKTVVDTLLAGSPSEQVVRIQGTGSGGRQATLDFVGAIQPPPDYADREGSSAQDLVLQAIYDTTNALWLRHTVVNNLATLPA